MGKVFTITEGLENMGALKTGGQGSVYKGRRIGEIITAVKLLPTPIFAESKEDKNYIDFQNEVEKLKKVNEQPNPNVVKILSYGVTETGSFPFIEMEYIEGPDLEELLKAPHDPIFTVKEVIKVAEQLASALAHCHRVDVKHGDIKSNNVKYNTNTGNYMLIDFGLAIMSDEQRRTSLRYAGAIEFMAPEQNEGRMLFQTDIYSFGIVIYELLAGSVPFPLTDKGETARNTVMVSHLETPPPDLLQLRDKNIPEGWSEEKKEHELLVPEWLLGVVDKCLQKNPEDRFSNGMELQEYIILNSTLASKKEETNSGLNHTLQQQYDKVVAEKYQIQEALLHYQNASAQKDKKLDELEGIILMKDNELDYLKKAVTQSRQNVTGGGGVSRPAFIALLLLTLGLGALATYSFLINKKQVQAANNTPVRSADTSLLTNNSTGNTLSESIQSTDAIIEEEKEPEPVEDVQNNNSTEGSEKQINSESKEVNSIKKEEQKQDDRNTEKVESQETEGQLSEYKVISKAYFHNQPDEATRRDAYIVHWNSAILKPTEEKDGFVYVVFTNDQGQTSKGWLRKKDLIAVNQ